MKFSLKLLVRVAVFGLVVAAFWGVPHCSLALKAQGLLWGVLASVFLGRFFCSCLCPLGIVQSAVHKLCHWRRHPRRVCTRLSVSKGQWVIRWGLVALLVALGAMGFTGLAWGLTPISIFGKAVSGVKALILKTPVESTVLVVSMGSFLLVVVLATFGKGRLWCNWICPYGTIYATVSCLVSRLPFLKDRKGIGCGACRACFGRPEMSTDDEEDEELNETEIADEGVTRRETLKGVATLAVVDKLTDGGYAGVSLPGVPERGTPVLPPGAGDSRRFSLKCIGCQLCVANCPGECLRPSVDLKRFGQPQMDFRRGSCIASCVRCGEVCPEGAIARLQPGDRKNVHMGHAEWKKDICIRTTEKTACTACVRKCPVRAIHLVGGFPVIDRAACIGCGACEHVCPARPQPAIFVKGHVEQRAVMPMDEKDLIREMKSLVDAGKACVIAKDGVIVRQLEGRGVRPIVDALSADPKAFEKTLAYDKIVGRAAAAVYVLGRAAKVAADVMSEDAVVYLEEHGIAALPAKRVPSIRNRENTGICPMERLVADMKDPEEMVKALRKAIKK